MDILKFAIAMEHDGEKYYRHQAEINKDNSLHTVCLMLAADEKKHAQILTDELNKKSCELIDTDTLSKAKNIFAGVGNIKNEDKETASQRDFYKIASEKERESIDLYAKYLSNAEEDKEKELFEYLISQEKQHFAVLEELVKLLGHAEEWVENAEFGIRERY